MKDHSSGYNKPTSRHDPLYHNLCGGRVDSKIDTCSWEMGWECSGCGQKWLNKTFEKFSLPDLADRFHTRPAPDFSSNVIVEKTEGKKTYTTVVNAVEALKYRKAKLT